MVLMTGDAKKSDNNGDATGNATTVTETQGVGGDDPIGDNSSVFEGPLYDYDLNEYITLGDLEKVTADSEFVENAVSDELKNVAAKYSEKKSIIDRPVQNGDFVVIDYVGTKDGIAFEGGSAENAELEIGSNTYIPGFESGLIGANIGDEVKLDLTFPEEYRNNPDLAGAKVVFTVKVKAITEVVYPELTDSMIEELNSDLFKTVDEFKAYYTIEASKVSFWQQYVESCKVLKYPEKELNYYKNNFISYYKQLATYYGMTIDQVVIGYFGFKSVDEFYTFSEEQAKVSILNEMVVYQTAKANNLTITDEEYKTEGLTVAEQNGYETLEELEKAVSKDFIELQILSPKVINFVYDMKTANKIS